mgnify:CR=1 FL=1
MKHRVFKKPAGQQKSRNGGRKSPTNNAQLSTKKEVVISDYSHDGRGISRTEGKTLFVEGALPGERVLAQVYSEHGRYSEARTLDVLEPSAARGKPVCGHYSACGGCNLQHVASAEQLALKETAVLDQFQRWSGLTPRRILPALISPQSGYRQRARMAVWYRDDGSIELGFRRAQSKSLVDVNACSVLDSRLNALLAPLRKWLLHVHGSRAVTHIELIATDSEIGVVVRHIKRLHAAALADLVRLASDDNVRIWLKPNSDAQLFNLDGEPCNPRMSYRLPEQSLQLQFHPCDFTQVNAGVNRDMINQALALLQLQKDERVLDLFCGVGNFTLPMARSALEIIGVEGAESMVQRGRENAELNGIDNCSYHSANLEADVSKLVWAKKPVDAILLDPPRAGAKGAMNWLQQLSASRVVYVSCNPATLARDAKLLASMGYQLEALGVMDMFPQTAHIESMALFTKR